MEAMHCVDRWKLPLTLAHSLTSHVYSAGLDYNEYV